MFTVQPPSIPLGVVAYTITVPVVKGVSKPFSSMVAVPVPFSSDQVTLLSDALAGVNTGIICTDLPSSVSPG